VCFKWKPVAGYRSSYGPLQVHTLRNMVARNYDAPHRFICVTDDPTGLECETVPLWNDYAGIPNPSFRGGPSCYRRLKLFHRDIGADIGERIVHMDLDIVITGDLKPLVDRQEPFVGWRNTNPLWPWNGSFFMLTAGAHPEVWESFDPATSPRKSHAAGCKGSDQGWMSYVLPRNLPAWTERDGVWSYQDQIAHRGRRPWPYKLPRDAKVVIFHGTVDPWSPEAKRAAPWVREHYR
jgi:hypothetical protein